jgi:hypothetical protein
MGGCLNILLSVSYGLPYYCSECFLMSQIAKYIKSFCEIDHLVANQLLKLNVVFFMYGLKACPKKRNGQMKNEK